MAEDGNVEIAAKKAGQFLELQHMQIVMDIIKKQYGAGGN